MTTDRITLVIALLSAAAATFAGEAVQIDVHDLLNARVIVTLVDGRLVPVKDGVDHGNGDPAHASAWATRAAAKGGEALPDDGHFAATARHPEVVLPYRNDDATGMQVRRADGPDEFRFAVPAKTYSSLLLWMMSASGPGKIHAVLAYADGTSDARDLQIPDFYWLLKDDDHDHCVLIGDLDKWTGTGGTMEKKHHSIFGLELHPDAAKVLTSVAVTKLPGGVATFYGATGATAP